MKDCMQIKSIEINKFRSIKRIVCDLSDISVFVGKNDAGKSNILKALNLFFNNQTELGKQLNFAEDFNYNSKMPKRADEISIKLTFSLPRNYWKNNGRWLVWEKRWREDGEVNLDEKDSFFGVKGDGKTVVNITAKSNVRSLARRVNFVYVPAVRDYNYFDLLRIRIYKTMTKVATTSLEKASATFEDYIKNPLKQLVSDTQQKLGEQVVMSFPKNLENVFEKLDFLAGENSVSLNKRGDGIKNRYIPLILNFIASNEKELAGKGAAPYTFIWGYEEPENNMEISNCMELCNEFSTYVQEDISQIILTTHSPVFYNIKYKVQELETSVCFVQKVSLKDGTTVVPEKENIDSEMGTAAKMSDDYRKLEKRLKEQHQELENVKKILENQARKPCLFVEGATDKVILERLFTVYNIPKTFNIETKTLNGGVNFVIDNLSAWELLQKHETKRIKACGIVDSDGEKEAREYNKNKDDQNITNCIVLPKNTSVKSFAQKNRYSVFSFLETFFPERIWKKAKENGWLEEKEREKILNETAVKNCLNGRENADELLENIPLFLSHSVKCEKKGNFSKLVLQLSNEELAEAFIDLKETLQKISEYLKKNNQ